jgi:hypothetical protein
MEQSKKAVSEELGKYWENVSDLVQTATSSEEGTLKVSIMIQ